MSKFDASKDYYAVLGADEGASRPDIDRLYKRLAAHLHPDRGGSEEEMKSLNEAYTVLKDETIRRDYDDQRSKPLTGVFRPASAPSARDTGVFGHCLSALLCLLVGLFLLFVVRSQWIWFLWPLAILAVFVIFFGVMMARSAMIAVKASLPAAHPFRRHTLAQEAMFWSAVVAAGYGIYLLFSSV
ncbi:MAG: DnaJ domain-containing protein [Acidobacteriota bacterium]|nr:DnaJ domain-containing protein [Acidobacteriota bacterium]